MSDPEWVGAREGRVLQVVLSRVGRLKLALCRPASKRADARRVDVTAIEGVSVLFTRVFRPGVTDVIARLIEGLSSC